MVRVSIKSHGILFNHPIKGLIRTPATFLIKEEHVEMYESLLKTSGADDFSMVQVDTVPQKNIQKKPQKSKPKISMNLDFKINQ